MHGDTVGPSVPCVCRTVVFLTTVGVFYILQGFTLRTNNQFPLKTIPRSTCWNVKYIPNVYDVVHA